MFPAKRNKLEAFSLPLVLFRNSFPDNKLDVRQVIKDSWKLLLRWFDPGSHFDQNSEFKNFISFDSQCEQVFW